MSESTAPKLIRLPQVLLKTGLSRSSIYALIKSGEFPRKISLTQKSMAFIESEVDEWILKRIAVSYSSPLDGNKLGVRKGGVK